MRRMLPQSVLGEVTSLDPAAIAQVREEAWPDVRDADELHDVLHTLIALPDEIGRGEGMGLVPSSGSRWVIYFERLLNEGRAGHAIHGERNYWVAAERKK